MIVRAAILSTVFAIGAAYAALPPGPAAGATPAGTTLTGEVCTTAPITTVAPEAGMPARQEIRCAGSVVGALIYTPFLSSKVDRELVSRRFRESRASAELQQRMVCKTGGWLDGAAAGGDALLAVPCALREGGWPHLILVSAKAGQMAIVDGAPGTLPVLLGLLKSPRAGDLRERQLAVLEKIWGYPITPIPAADIAALNDALRAGRTANGMANFGEAEAAFREALDLQTGRLKANDEAVSATLLDLALNVSNQSLSEEAAALFRRATPALQASISGVPRARLTTYLALDAANRGDLDQALAFSRSAVGMWRDMGGDQQAGVVSAANVSAVAATTEQGELANALNLQARLELRGGNVVQAYAAASEGLLILNKANVAPRWWKADSLIALGEISVAQNRISAAEAYFNAALKLRRQIFGDTAPAIQVLAALGGAYQREDMSTSAIVTYREVFRMARALPSTAGIFTAEMLVPFASAVAEVAQTLQDPVEKQGLFAEAFDAFQLVQSPVVDKTIAQAAARLSTDNPAIGKLVGDLQDQQRAQDQARVKLAYEQSLPDNERSSQAENDIRAELASTGQAIASARQTLTAQFPQYERLVSPSTLELDQLRASLKPGEGLLSFLVGRDKSFAQLVTRDGVVVAPVEEGAAGIRQAVTALRRPLEIQGGAVGEFNLAAAHQMHELLLGGLKPSLAAIDHLIVVPSGPLSNLPFQLLVATPAPDGAYSQADWLIRSKTLAYTPSLQAFSALRGARPKAQPRQELLAFGNPALVGHTTRKGEMSPMAQLASSCRKGGPMPSALLEALEPLPDTAKELATVAATLRAPAGSVFLARDATEANLRKQDLADFRILYFATHGLLPGELKCQGEPGLVLTPPATQEGGKASDGLLESSEIASLRLNADLVVLSACNTAAGDNRLGGGDAVSGLAEAFFHAGARNMLVSHWQVPSAATSELMSSLFTTLGTKEGQSVGDGLRKAQLGLIGQERTAHPFFWAAFVVMGDGLGRAAPAAVDPLKI